MRKFFHQCTYLLDAEAKKELPFLTFIFIISSLLDVLGLGMIGAFLLLVVNFHASLSRLPEFIQHFLNQFSQRSLLTDAGIIIICLFIIKAIIGIKAQSKIAFFSARFATRIKSRLMAMYQNASYAFHLKQNSAYIVNKMTQIDRFSSGVISPSLNLFSNTLIILGVTITLLILHPITTVFLSLTFGTIVFIYNAFIKKRVFQIGKIIYESGGEMNKGILQGLGGLLEIRILGKEIFFAKKLKTAAYDYAKALAMSVALQQIPRYSIESGAAIFLIILMLGGLWSGLSAVDIIPTIGIFAAACLRLLPTVNQLMGNVSQIQTSAHSLTMICQEMHALEKQLETSLNIGKEVNKLPFSQLALINASFRYPEAKREALQIINMNIQRGESIGIMGPSGAGKSTLVNLILGLLKPVSGQLLIDGKPIDNIRAWLNNIAYIPQHIFLLDDTLKANIALGMQDEGIDDKILLKAIHMAQLTSVVDELPQGVNTLIGENGVRLSGGQRQRVALARAFYFKRDIIIMDEATSALDSETEKEVIDSIQRLHGIKTLIVIAHRLTTIEYCDRVYKLSEGKLVSFGTFAEVVGIQ